MIRKVLRNIIRGFASVFLILAIFFIGVPFDGIVHIIEERNIVDLLYKAEKSSNVVDSLFKDIVLPKTEKTSAATNDAMLVFNSKVGTSTMQYRVWNGSSWGSESTTSDFHGSEIRWAQMKYAPNRDEAILVVLTNTGQVQAQIYDGSFWGETTILSTLSDLNGSSDGGSLYRGFDVEYEQSSGDAIVVSGDGTADPNYHVWDGSTWSLNNNIDIPTTGRPNWIELAAPMATTTNDSLALITLDSNSDIYGMRWTGSSWDNMGVTTTWDAAASISTRKAIDVAFETGTGDIMFLWGDSVAADDHNYRTYAGGALSSIVALPNSNAGGQPNWVRLAPNTTSGANVNQIMLGTLDSAADLSTFIWSGTAWSAVHAEHSAAVENAAVQQDFEIVFETHVSNPDDAWLLWNNGSTVSRKLWNGPTAAWGSATTVGDDSAGLVLNSHPNNGAVLAGIYEDTSSASDDISEIHLTGGSQTWSSLADFWTGPVQREIGLLRMAQAVQSYNNSNEAMVAYVTEGSTSYPQYARWNGSSWGSVASTSPTAGEIRHMVLKAAPTRDELMLVTLGHTGQVQAQVYSGESGAWGSAQLLNTMNNSQGTRDTQSLYRGFDIEYESASGDAIVVTGDGTADPNYHVWDGSSWTGPTDINIPNTGRPNWIELAAPLATTTNDSLAFILVDSNVDVYGMRWTGSAWDNMGAAAVWDATGAIATEKSVDVAFETGSGDIMFIWGDSVSTDQYYRTYSGGSLSAATLLDNAQAGAVNNWMRLAPNPTGGSFQDQILYAVLDGGSDLNTFMWSGTAWSSVHTEHTAAAENHSNQVFDIAFETHSSNPDDAWLAYGDGNTISRKLWNGATQTWGSATTQGDDTDYIALNAHPNTGAFFMAAYESSASASDDATINNLSGGSQTWGSATSIWPGPVGRVGLGLTQIAIASDRYQSPTFEQSAYRLFTNTNSADVGSPLALQDTSATLSSTGDAFRLRTLIHVGSNQLTTGSTSFKLQYAEKSGTCDTSFSGETYADVTGATPIAFNDNASPVDGASLVANVNDPTHGGHAIVNQDYEESNNFTNSEAAIPAGQDGKWDFSLIDNGAPANTSYCFRIVKSGGALLDTYTVIPEVSTADGAPSLTFTVTTNNFGSIVPGFPVFATSTLSVNTNNSSGWFVTVSADDVTDTVQTMDLTTDTNIEIMDLDPQWIAPVSTTTTSNAISITNGQNALAFRVMTASGTTSFRSTSWWGSGDDPYTTARWAGFASSSAPTTNLKIGISSTDSGGEAINTIQYYLDVSESQLSGDYSGSITFTAVAN